MQIILYILLEILVIESKVELLSHRVCAFSILIVYFQSREASRHFTSSMWEFPFPDYQTVLVFASLLDENISLF